jgi:hypothetical protein
MSRMSMPAIRATSGVTETTVKFISGFLRCPRI